MATNEPLDAKQLSRGMRVMKISGERQGVTGTVKGVDWANNLIGVEFDGDNRTTFECTPAEFKVITSGIRITGKPPPHTIARGSLK